MEARLPDQQAVRAGESRHLNRVGAASKAFVARRRDRKKEQGAKPQLR